jgi:hypothetical protein
LETHVIYKFVKPIPFHKAPNFRVKSGYIWKKGRFWGTLRKLRSDRISG